MKIHDLGRKDAHQLADARHPQPTDRQIHCRREPARQVHEGNFETGAEEGAGPNDGQQPHRQKPVRTLKQIGV